MAPSSDDERAHRRREAVQSELQRLRAHDQPEDREEADMVETVGKEQRRARAAREDDDGED